MIDFVSGRLPVATYM